MSNTNITTVANTGDRIKVTSAILVVMAGIFAYSYFADMSIYARVGIFVGSLAVAGILIWISDSGQRGIAFAKGAYNEMKRVVCLAAKKLFRWQALSLPCLRYGNLSTADCR